MAYEHRLVVRYGETDQMGVVHHANYLAYLEEARTAYMRALGAPYRALEEAGVGLPVRKAELRYRAPALYEDELVVRVAVTRMKAASITFDYVITRPADELVLLTGAVELACIDLRAQPRRPRMLPEDLRSLIPVEGP